jgi:hypothetical protein
MGTKLNIHEVREVYAVAIDRIVDSGMHETKVHIGIATRSNNMLSFDFVEITEFGLGKNGIKKICMETYGMFPVEIEYTNIR